MGKKITWVETFSTTAFYSAEITDEQAELFETDRERFFDEVEFRDNQELVREKVSDYGPENFEIDED